MESPRRRSPGIDGGYQQVAEHREPDLKPTFHPTQRTQRKKRNEMTSLLDRPITAASDDGVCR